MIDFLKKLFGQSSSGATAKERLRLVLMTDHLALAPEIIENMKRDLVDVISRYVEVDREKVEVNFEREDKALAMLANIPIRAVNRPTDGGGGGGVKTEPVVETPKAEEPTVVATSSFAGAPNVASPGVHAQTTPGQAANGGAPPRRKRRKKAQGTGQAQKPATAH